MRALKEADIQRYFKKRVLKNGGLFRKVHWEGRRSAPDTYVSFLLPEDDSYCCFVELKSPGEKPRPDQVREHNRMLAAGTNVEWFDTYEKIDKWLRRIIWLPQ